MKPVAMTLALLAVLALPARAQTTYIVTASGTANYLVNEIPDPTLELLRGQTYTFQVDAIGHPFWIKTAQVVGTGSAYTNGVTNNGIQGGTLTFTVPMDAPDRLYYQCQIHVAMTGIINISSPTPTRPATWGRLKAQYR